MSRLPPAVILAVVPALVLSPSPGAAQGPPLRAGSTSALVRYAYFTKDTPAITGRIRESELPRSYREFDADADQRVVFVAVLNRTGDFKLRAILKDAQGRQRDAFDRRVHSEGRGAWSLAWWELGMRWMRIAPGPWTVDLFVDDHKVGSFPFAVKMVR